MAKYIDADKLKNNLLQSGAICDFGVFLIEKQLAADAQEVKRGRWLINPDGYYPYCSECQKEPQGRVMTDWCPNCGAEMDGKEVVKKDYNPCNKCTHKGWNMPQCQYCNKANGYKYMELDIEKFMESKNVPDRKDGE